MRKAGDVGIQLLGPVRLVDGDAVVDVGGDVRRGLLALLALHAGTPVDDETIRTGLWGDTPPAGAVASVRSHLSRLRRAAPGVAVHRSTGGYVLDVAPSQVDALAVRGALDAARSAGPEAGLAPLEQALEAWRGAPLADVRRFPFAAGAAAQLEELHLDLSRARAERWLQLGRDPGAVVTWLAELAPLTAGDERTAQLRMLALYRAGRQREALQVYTELRDHLRREAGLDPSAATRDVHARILAQDASLLHGPVTNGAGRGVTAIGTAASTPQQAVPAARPLAPPPLPIPLSSFVGRERELADLRAAMEASRLVTITGAGGTGKTRLAVEALRRLGRTEVDGPWMVQLAEVDAAELVASAFAQTLGVTTGPRTTLETIATAIGGRAALLLVDNCEHLVDTVAEHLAVLLTRCPFLRVLATSREPLAIDGERVIALYPLPADGDAVTLFTDRAQAADRTFSLDEATRPQVVQLCAALDGIPLAIELAAARMQTLSLEQILTLLGDRFRLLTSNHRGAPARHRTLGAAIAWSISMLGAAEREVLTACAAFTGTFSLDALAAVRRCDVTDLVAPLSSLVSKSVVTVAARSGVRRYRLLDTIREYVRDQADAATLTELADRHAAWAASVTEEGYTATYSTRAWITLLRDEQPNLRAALDHALTRDPVTALRLAGGLSWFWYRRGHANEGLAWLERSLAAAPDAPAVLRGRALVGITILRYLSGRLPAARTAAREATAAAEQTDDATLRATAGMYRAYMDAAAGDLRAAEELLAATAHDHLPTWIRAERAMVAGQLRRARHDPRGALAVLTEAEDLAEECGHTWAWGSARWIAAKIMIDAGCGVEAAQVLVEVLQRFTTDGDRTSALAVLHTLAATGAATGRLLDAATLFGAVAALGRRIGYDPVRMDPVDGPRHRALVLDQMPPRLVEQALARGAGLSLREALALAQSLADVGSHAA